MTDRRPAPDALLRAAAGEGRGRLKIFLGAAPGVGKTFEMLGEGAERQAGGVDVAVAIVETHGRRETEALVAPLEVVSRRTLEHRGHRLEEMDLDAVLARAPALALVDELAHTNAAGSRHAKRWQDVEELLAAGIDVLTTLNVQHIESLNDVVASFSRVRVRETVPDHVLEGAEIEVVDLPPDELIERLKAGKVYGEAEATRALGNFFSHENLAALREMALRHAAQSVDRHLVERLDARALPGTYAGGERVLVAVNELPGGDGIVRAGKRMADALRAPWSAVTIETPRSATLGEADRRRVADALRLAATLGATIASIPAATVVEGLAAQIAATRTTQLVIGRSRRSWWFTLRHGSVVERLVRASEGLAIHVIPAGDRVPSGLQLPQLGGWPPYAAGAALITATTLAALVLEPRIGGGAIDLLYLLPVLLASIRFGRWPGLATGILAGLAYNFFFLPPRHTFQIADPESVVTILILLALAVVTANLADRLRVRASISMRSAGENAAVAAFGQALARCADWQATGDAVCAELNRALGVSARLMVERDRMLTVISEHPSGLPAFGPVDRAAADWAWNRAEPSGRDTGTLGAADWQFHPLSTTLGTLAVVALARADGEAPIRADQATLLSTLLGQAALAHERLQLEDQLRDVRVLQERDKLRSAVLSSIGHDLRTPLTGATAAIDAIGARHPDEPAVATARSELARLRRFLANLIEMVRLDSGALEPQLEPTDLTDAVEAALHDVRDLLPDEQLHFAVPADLPLIVADPRLLHHILLNLLTNAAVHGKGRVTVVGTRAPGTVRLSIIDAGPGLPPSGEEALFGSFSRSDARDRADGTGLGLMIARSFAEAMGVTLHARNSDGGGAELTLTFTLST